MISSLKKWWLKRKLRSLGVCPEHISLHEWLTWEGKAYCPLCKAQKYADAERYRQKCVEEAIEALKSL